MLEDKELADLVLESVRLVDEGELNPPAGAAASPAFQPRGMLALLTYCYAIGVYGSQDVELMMREDASLRALCGWDIPDWRIVRRLSMQVPIRRTYGTWIAQVFFRQVSANPISTARTFKRTPCSF